MRHLVARRHATHHPFLHFCCSPLSEHESDNGSGFYVVVADEARDTTGDRFSLSRACEAIACKSPPRYAITCFWEPDGVIRFGAVTTARCPSADLQLDQSPASSELIPNSLVRLPSLPLAIHSLH